MHAVHIMLHTDSCTHPGFCGPSGGAKCTACQQRQGLCFPRVYEKRAIQLLVEQRFYLLHKICKCPCTMTGGLWQEYTLWCWWGRGEQWPCLLSSCFSSRTLHAPLGIFLQAGGSVYILWRSGWSEFTWKFHMVTPSLSSSKRKLTLRWDTNDPKEHQLVKDLQPPACLLLPKSILS